MLYRTPALRHHTPFSLPEFPDSVPSASEKQKGGDPVESPAYILQLFPPAAV
jgi:hypothetical protein